MDEIYVSIFMLTYNQEEYIAQAIDGVLMQQTEYRFQLVIGEDRSTDRTREICKEYAEKFPDKIKLLLNKKNLGLIGNYVKTYSQCTGKYVAICDGDDYWIDPLKLQRQVEILESDPSTSIVYSAKYNLFPTGEQVLSNSTNNTKITSFDELVMGNYIPSVTVLFRNKPLPENMTHWMQGLPYGDWPTYLWVTVAGGKIFYLDFPTAVYRKNFGTSTLLRKERSNAGRINTSILEKILNDKDFRKKRTILKKSLIKHKMGLMASYNKEGKYLTSFKYAVLLFFQTNPLRVCRLYLHSSKIPFFC